MHSIVVTVSGEGDFGAFFESHAENAEEVQQELTHGGSDEKVVAFIPLREDDPGVNAVASVLALAVEASSGGEEVLAETLLLEIFMAGRRLGNYF